MPRVTWSGLDAGDVDGFDRDSQIKPYAGPIPPDGMYMWAVKVLQHREGDRQKNPQLRVGLELVPRSGSDYRGERKYKGYFTMDFIPMADNTAFRYVPLLDVLGVTGKDLVNNTITDEDGNIKKIGRYRHDGKALVMAQLIQEMDQNGNPKAQKNIKGGAYFEPPKGEEYEEEDDLPEDDEYGEDIDDDEYDFDDEEEDERPKRQTSSQRKSASTRARSRGAVSGNRATAKSSSSARRGKRRRPRDDEDDF